MSQSTDRMASAVRWLGWLPMAAVAALLLFLAQQGSEALRTLPLRCLAGTVWLPTAGRFGLLPALAGTLASSVLALLVAMPLGVAAAIGLHALRTGRLSRVLETVLGVGAGLPSVVVGLVLLRQVTPLLGPSLLAAVVTLVVMLAPAAALLALAALRQVGSDVRTAAFALGLTPSAVVRCVALQEARRPLLAAALALLARGLGEGVAVSLVIGNVAAWPPTLTGAATTLTATLVTELNGAAGVHAQVLALAALVVSGLIASASLAARTWLRTNR